jgi:hypothetical protein
MYENGKKMRPVETILVMERWGYKESDGEGEFKMYLICCKNFCKCHNVPLPNITIKNFFKTV